MPAQPVNSLLKVAFASAAVVVIAWASIACGSPAVTPSSSAVQSPAPSPSLTTARMTVAGSAPQFTADLPAGWEPFDFGARWDGDPPPAFFASLVDNTFTDPCTHEQRSPKVGSTVEALSAALAEIPGTTATEPVQT